jgi:hypothetical protein
VDSYFKRGFRPTPDQKSCLLEFKPAQAGPVGTELKTPKDVDDLGFPKQTYSALYYPWVKVANPAYHAETNPGAPKTVLVPPSGFAAGMWAKTDRKRGVWKAPAGLESSLLGVAGLQYAVDDGVQDSLNPLESTVCARCRAQAM